jgi:hypothetical protein
MDWLSNLGMSSEPVKSASFDVGDTKLCSVSKINVYRLSLHLILKMKLNVARRWRWPTGLSGKGRHCSGTSTR